MVDNIPSGMDEQLASTRIVELFKYGDFDHVAVDTKLARKH